MGRDEFVILMSCVTGDIKALLQDKTADLARASSPYSLIFSAAFSEGENTDDLYERAEKALTLNGVPNGACAFA